MLTRCPSRICIAQRMLKNSLASTYPSHHQHHFNTNAVEFQETTNPPFEKILIANRGECAVRILKTCQKMGIKTVAVHSEADSGAYFATAADESLCIGPASPVESYSQIDHILNAAKLTGAQAVHPGFNILSQNTDYVQSLQDNNITFIGPRYSAIQSMEESNEIALNTIIQSISHENELNETQSADFVSNLTRIEIPLLFDNDGNYVWFNEIERLIPNIYEESPSFSKKLTPTLRKSMAEKACSLAKAVNFVSAGSVEFLFDPVSEKYYFLRMNTSLSPNHCIIECLYGIDLVEYMINIASGKPLTFKQSDIDTFSNGSTILTNVYAQGLIKPKIGTIHCYHEPFHKDLSIRIDSSCKEGTDNFIIPSYYTEIEKKENQILMDYDGHISKLIVHHKNRKKALNKMNDVLESIVINGVRTNIPYLRHIVNDLSADKEPILKSEFKENDEYNDISDDEYNYLIITAAKIYNTIRDISVSNNTLFIQHECQVEEEVVKYNILCNNLDDLFMINNDHESFAINTNYSPGDWLFSADINDDSGIYQLIDYDSRHELVLKYKGLSHSFNIRTDSDIVFSGIAPDPDAVGSERGGVDPKLVLLSPITGTVFAINIRVGDHVYKGQEAVTIEAMKMKNIWNIEKNGIVKSIGVAAGDQVVPGAKIYEIEPIEKSKKVELLIKDDDGSFKTSLLIDTFKFDDDIDFDVMRDEIYKKLPNRDNIPSSKHLLLSWKNESNSVIYSKKLSEQNLILWDGDESIICVEILTEELLKIYTNARLLNVYSAIISKNMKDISFMKPIRILYNEKQNKLIYSKLNNKFATGFNVDEEHIIAIFKNKTKEWELVENDYNKKYDENDTFVIFDTNKTNMNKEEIQKYIQQNNPIIPTEKTY